METSTPAYPRPATLSALLAFDAGQRVVGIAGGLVPLEACAPQSWDFSAPTLTAKDLGGAYGEKTLCPDSTAFAQGFYKAYPALQGVPLDGLLVAGSAAGQFLPRVGSEAARLWTAADVDLFLHGHATPADSQARLRRFIADLDAASHRREREAIRDRLKAAAAEDGPTPSRPRAVNLAGQGGARAEACRRILGVFDELEFAPGEDLVTWRPMRPQSMKEEIWAHALHLAPNMGYMLPEVEVTRTAGSITIYADSVCLQVVLRHYATPSEILHGFDLGPAAVGFDGARVWLTEMGRFAYEHRCLVVDTGRRSLTYEARLAKYHSRGFNLVLPGLSMAALPRRNLKYGYKDVADLPGFPFAYSAIVGNRIEFDAFPVTFGPCSDYGAEDKPDPAEENCFARAYMNLYRLVNGRTDFIYAAEGLGYAVADAVLTKPPHLTLEMMQSLYDQFRGTCWDGARLNTRALERYVPVAPVKDIAAAVFAEGRPMGDVLDAAFAAQRAEATRLWKLRIQGADHSVLPWVTENPGGQQGPLTGSRNPVVENPADWYGEYLAQDEVQAI